MAKKILLDTNILVYSTDEASSFFSPVCEAIKGLSDHGFSFFINNQILREYACVATKPEPKGLGLNIKVALVDIAAFESSYNVLPDYDKIWIKWKHLVKAGNHKGLRLHDTYIVASMVVHEIKYILTLNEKDFKNIKEIEPVSLESWKNLI